MERNLRVCFISSSRSYYDNICSFNSYNLVITCTFFLVFQGEKGEVGMQGKDGSASKKVFLVCLIWYKILTLMKFFIILMGPTNF